MTKQLLALALAALLPTAALADSAEAVWKAKCKSCHGADGKAQTKQGKEHKIDVMTVAAWQTKWTDEKIKDVVLNGVEKTKMKAFKGKVSEEEIAEITKMIRGFAAK